MHEIGDVGIFVKNGINKFWWTKLVTEKNNMIKFFLLSASIKRRHVEVFDKAQNGTTTKHGAMFITLFYKAWLKGIDISTSGVAICYAEIYKEIKRDNKVKGK